MDTDVQLSTLGYRARRTLQLSLYGVGLADLI